MSLKARRLLGLILIALVIVIAVLLPGPAAHDKSSKTNPVVQKRPPIFIYANKLASQQGRIPAQIKINHRTVRLDRRGSYSRLCIDNGCALLQDNNRRFLVLIGPGARKSVWRRVP